jgi:hypothetical protein
LSTIPTTYEEVMDAARKSDPEAYAVLCSKYPVLSRRQMRTISEIEIPVGLHPELRAGRTVASVTEATYAELTLQQETP